MAFAGYHGAAIERAADAMVVAGRSCGSCSLCCKAVPIDKPPKSAGVWCVHHRAGKGCTIRATRPIICRAFYCGWMLTAELGEEWKPDISKFVLVWDGRSSLIAYVDPDDPSAWKREPYYGVLKKWSTRAHVAIHVREQLTVILPDRDVELGVINLGDQVVYSKSGNKISVALKRKG